VQRICFRTNSVVGSGNASHRTGTLAEPSLIILDEPVSALDVSIRAQIMNLLQDLQEQFDVSYLLIAHDLAAVLHLSTTVAVMYLGKLSNSPPVSSYEWNHPSLQQGLFSAACRRTRTNSEKK